MAGWRDLGNIWTTFRELDVRPIREEAEHPVTLAVVGREGVGKSTLIDALRHEARARERVTPPVVEIDLKEPARLESADLIVLVLDATRGDLEQEEQAYVEWKLAGRPVLVFYNKMDAVTDSRLVQTAMRPWSDAGAAFGSALDPESLKTELVPRVLAALPNRHLALARHYPVFRLAVARALIGDTSFANASYSLGTGLAEIVPALDIPFNVADVVILTKNQALMVYKLGLALGLSPRWQDHVTQLGGVVGAGFMWRQVARQLVGLIPVWGIVPKVAVAYAGTYAVGEAVVYWYRTGEKISGERMRQVYANALARGRAVAQRLLARARRPARPHLTRPALPRLASRIVCSHCGRENATDATYCAYCGRPLGR